MTDNSTDKNKRKQELYEKLIELKAFNSDEACGRFLDAFFFIYDKYNNDKCKLIHAINRVNYPMYQNQARNPC